MPTSPYATALEPCATTPDLCSREVAHQHRYLTERVFQLVLRRGFSVKQEREGVCNGNGADGDGRN
jgi:hypothetical protein